MLSLPRRGFLALSGGLLAGVTGCQVSDPTIVGGPTAPPIDPSPTPPPDVPGREIAWRHEAELAVLAWLVADGAERLRLGPGQAATARWMAGGHEVHATALLHPRPARRSTAPPTPVPGSMPRPVPSPSVDFGAGTREQALTQLRDRLGQALTDHRRMALGSQGPTGLVWGSLAAYARAADAALVRDAPRPEPPALEVRPLEPWTDAEAMQQALRQVHALVYGYQVAIPWFRRPESERAHDLLVARRELRDYLAGTLRDQGHTAPPAEPAYRMAGAHDRNTAAELLWRMEASFAPFAGAWLASAADAASRRRALETLEQAAVLCVDWGGPLVVWPGWPDA